MSTDAPLQNGRILQMLAEGEKGRKGKAGVSSVTPPVGSMPRYGNAAKRQFLSAAHSRLHSDWPSTNMSSDELLFRNLRSLRGRSRWLAENNGYYMRYIALNVDNIAGPRGARLEAKVQRPNGTPDTVANDKIELAWKQWGKKGSCTKRSSLSFTDLQRMIIGTVVRDGEVFVRKWYAAKNKNGYALELVDSMRVPAEYSQVIDSTTEIINGIKYVDGEVVSYFIAKRGMKSDWVGETYEEVEAKFILHLFRPLWAEQKRGYPWLAAGMQRIHMLDRYENAEIIASRVAAEKGGFFTRTAEAEGAFSGEGDDDGDDEIQYMDSEAGSFGLLPEGYAFTQFDPQHPTSAFESLSNKLLKGIASAGNINYTSLANDLSEVNYSSARIGMLEVRDNWQAAQTWFTEWFHEPVYADWLLMSLSAGALALPFSGYEGFLRVCFVARSWAWVDPLKESMANRKNLEMRTTSISDIAAQSGDEIEDVFDRIQKEMALAKEKGIDLTELFGAPQQSSASITRRLDEIERRLAGYKINGVKKEYHVEN